jgi:hypothetical protein
MNDVTPSKKLSKPPIFRNPIKNYQLAYQIKFGKKKTKKKRLDNASSPNQKTLIHSRNFS